MVCAILAGITAESVPAGPNRLDSVISQASPEILHLIKGNLALVNKQSLDTLWILLLSSSGQPKLAGIPRRSHSKTVSKIEQPLGYRQTTASALGLKRQGGVQVLESAILAYKTNRQAHPGEMAQWLALELRSVAEKMRFRSRSAAFARDTLAVVHSVPPHDRVVPTR